MASFMGPTGPTGPTKPPVVTDDDDEFEAWKASRKASAAPAAPADDDDPEFAAWKRAQGQAQGQAPSPQTPHGATGSWGDTGPLAGPRRTFRDLSMAFGNGLAPGFADEIQARMEPGNTQQNELVERAGMARFAKAHPVGNFLTEGAGMIANPLGRGLGLVKGGALFGGLAGAGEANGSAGDRLGGAAVGSAAGAATGGMLGHVVAPFARVGYDAAKAGAKALMESPTTQATIRFLEAHPIGLTTQDVSKNVGGLTPGSVPPPNAARAASGLGARVAGIAKDLGPRSPNDRANQLLLDKLASDKMQLDQVRAAMGLTEKPVALGDLAGDNLLGLQRGARSVPSEAKDAIPKALHERASQQPVRVRGDIEAAAGVSPVDVLSKVDELAARQKANAKPLYDAAYAKPPITDPEVLSLFRDPDVKRAYASAARQAKREGVILPPIAQAATSPMPVQGFDYIKRGMDDYIERRMGAGKIGRNEARQLRTALSDALTRVDEIVPEYAQARQQFAGDQRLRDMLDMGREFSNTDDREIARLVRTLSPSEREVYAQGALDDLTQQIRGTTDGHDVVRKVFGNDLKREALRSLVGDEAFQGLSKGLETEQRMLRSKNFTLGGSNTVDKAQEAFDIDKAGIPQAALQLMRGKLGDATVSLGQSALVNRLRGVTTETANALAPKLIAGMNGDRQALDEVLRELLAFQRREIQRSSTRGTAARPLAGSIGGFGGGTSSRR